MASSQQPRHQIKRVPVPVRHSPASISTTGSPSPQVITQTESSSSLLLSSSSSSLPSTRTPIVIRGQQRPRGPIQLVATNSHQPLPASASHGYEHGHSQLPNQHSLYTIRMDSESHSNYGAIPAQVEEDIKASVRASMLPTGHTTQERRRRSVRYKKALRWTSVSLAILAVFAETAVSIIRNFTSDALFAIVWPPLLSLWNAWRLFRLRRKHDIERISWVHLAGEVVFLGLTIFLTALLISDTVNITTQDDNESWYPFTLEEYFWRNVAVLAVFAILLIIHTILLIITLVEKCTKPKYEQVALTADSQQPPTIIVQYMPACPTCHGHVEPQPGEDTNSYVARIGDLQPQGVAPAYFSQPKEAKYNGEADD